MSKLKQIRQNRLLSKLELARKAGVSVVTLDRVENGFHCRMSTMRKILEALDVPVEDKDLVFDFDEDENR